MRTGNVRNQRLTEEAKHLEHETKSQVFPLVVMGAGALV